MYTLYQPIENFFLSIHIYRFYLFYYMQFEMTDLPLSINDVCTIGQLKVARQYVLPFSFQSYLPNGIISTLPIQQCHSFLSKQNCLQQGHWRTYRFEYPIDMDPKWCPEKCRDTVNYSS